MSSPFSPDTSPPFWKTFFRAALPFGIFFAAMELFLFQRSPVVTAVTSFISAGLFGGITTMFSRSDWFRGSTVPSLAESEEIRYSGAATHFRGWEGVGGRLFLTEDRLVFQPHTLNIQSGEQSWPLSAIEDAQLSRIFLVVPTGLDVQLRSGETERFGTWDRQQWRAAIAKSNPEDRTASAGR